MAFFSKLAFWKKKDDLDSLGKDMGLDKDLGLDLGGPSPDLGMGIEPTQQQPYQKYPSFQQQGVQQQQFFQPDVFPVSKEHFVEFIFIGSKSVWQEQSCSAYIS